MHRGSCTELNLLAENAELRARLEAAEDVLQAIRIGEVDALVVESAAGPRIYVLQGVDAASNRFRGDILAQVSDAVIATDDDQRVTYMNAAAERQYDVCVTGALGKLVSNVYRSQWVDAGDEAAATTALRERGEWHGESIHIRLDGRELRVESSVTALGMIGGQPAGMLAVIRDITQRSLAQDRLRESEALYRSVLEASPDCLKIIDNSGHIEYMNANGCELMEIDDFSLWRGTKWSSLWSVGNEEDVKKAIAAAMAGNATRFEAFGATSKGQFKWWDVFVSPILGDRGQTLRIFASSREITEKKRANAQIRESQARLSHAADAAMLSYVAVDLERGYLQTSENFAMVMGYATLSEEAMDGATGPQLLLDHVVTHDRLRVATALQKFLSGTEPSGKIDYMVLGDDDIERSIETVWSVEYAADGKPLRAFATNLDISERKRGEEKTKLLMGEVNHRAKNLLAVVQAVAQHTAKHGDPTTFVERLSERISGLAASHDLLVRNQWEGVAMADLVTSQLAHLQDLIGARVHIHGLPTRLTPSAAQGIGMALHELATNAGKYGSLSNGVGQVQLSWHIEMAIKPILFISWLETGGPNVVPPQRNGFGQMVLGRMVEGAVDGTAAIDYQETGVCWTLRASVAATLERGWVAPSKSDAA